VVFATTVSTISIVILGVRPGRGASFKRPSIPCSINRPRHSATMRVLTLCRSPICLFCIPSTASNTIRLRSTTRAAIEPGTTHQNSYMRGMVLDGEIGVWKIPFSILPS